MRQQRPVDRRVRPQTETVQADRALLPDQAHPIHQKIRVADRIDIQIHALRHIAAHSVCQRLLPRVKGKIRTQPLCRRDARRMVACKHDLPGTHAFSQRRHSNADRPAACHHNVLSRL